MQHTIQLHPPHQAHHCRTRCKGKTESIPTSRIIARHKEKFIDGYWLIAHFMTKYGRIDTSLEIIVFDGRTLSSSNVYWLGFHVASSKYPDPGSLHRARDRQLGTRYRFHSQPNRILQFLLERSPDPLGTRYQFYARQNKIITRFFFSFLEVSPDLE